MTSGTTTGPGNPTTMRGGSYAFNADNQFSGSGCAYDGDGNPVTYNGTACAYDPEGRLTSYGSGSTWSWDGDGHWGSAGLIYDGDTPVAVLGGGGYTNALTWGPDGLLSDHTSGGNSLYDLYDPSGDAAQRWGAQGSIGQSSALDGFGRRFDATGGDFYDGYQAQWGGWWNLSTSGDGGSTGLVLLGHRFYDTAAGRFLTRDPLGYGGGIDLYAYTQNDPVNSSDPSGLVPFHPLPPGYHPMPSWPLPIHYTGPDPFGPFKRWWKGCNDYFQGGPPAPKRLPNLPPGAFGPNGPYGNPYPNPPFGGYKGPPGNDPLGGSPEQGDNYDHPELILAGSSLP